MLVDIIFKKIECVCVHEAYVSNVQYKCLLHLPDSANTWPGSFALRLQAGFSNKRAHTYTSMPDTPTHHFRHYIYLIVTTHSQDLLHEEHLAPTTE